MDMYSTYMLRILLASAFLDLDYSQDEYSHLIGY